MTTTPRTSLFESDFRLFIGALLILLLPGCIMPGTPWPSRAMSVSLSSAGVDASAVADEVQVVVQARGFTREGPDGYEVMTNQIITRAYKGPDHVVVSIGLEDPVLAPIRVSSDAARFTPEAEEVYAAIRARLESRWPGSVREEP